jgi:cell cycle arrest protein BUB3
LRPFGVNAVAFHPVTGAFATGGGDGYVCVWDGLKKKRLWQSTRYPASVACLAFSGDGRRIAVAVSRERRNENSEDDATAFSFSDAVFVRRVEDAEVTPKRK